MNDISRTYYDNFSIFLIAIFDPNTNQILFYQVIKYLN